ncbi:MAG: hypothetical protein HN975_19205 [Anaerolineae bacterium]|nr:hypothetical protein [Anaerolineae bacterium]
MKLRKYIWTLALLLILVTSLSACELQSVAEAEVTPTEIDPAAIFTAAAETVAAQLTQTAAAFSPTPAPATATPTMLPTATLVNLDAPTPIGGAIPTLTLQPGIPTLVPTLTPVTVLSSPEGPICDQMEYGSPLDINIPDGSTMKAGEDFEKIWRIRNTGVCAWDDGYQLVPVASSSTRPGDTNPLDAANPAWEVKTLVQPGEVVDIGAKLTAPSEVGEYSTCFIMVNDRGVYFGGVVCVEIVVKSD